MKRLLAALAASFALLPAAAQSPAYTPTAQEVQKARANAARDAKLAEALEKARLKEEAKPVAAYIPKEAKPREDKAAKPRQPAVFTAAVPAPKAEKKAKK